MAVRDTGSLSSWAYAAVVLTEVALAVLGNNEMPPSSPLRGIAYGALPCKEHACGGHGGPSENMIQSSYEVQWGAAGRDDLGIMKTLGANAVRMYHSLGVGESPQQSGFLNRAQEIGLNVFAGYHTEMANHPGACPDYDCYETWKAATLRGFENGFKVGDDWHPAVSTLILLNEPDFFVYTPKCQPSGAWCRVKAVLSALDGVLSAEKEAGIQASRAKFSVTWSFGVAASIDGKVSGPGIFGFQDVAAGIADPSIARYTPRASLDELFDTYMTRWLNGLNTQAPWDFVKSVISTEYSSRFSSIPWYVGEYGANGQPEEVIRGDLISMGNFAAQDNDFIGAAIFQFQTAYWKGGAEMNFGLFGLKEEVVAHTGPLCDEPARNCSPWPVHCLTTDLSWLPGRLAHRAEAVASAWGGAVEVTRGFCAGQRRVSSSGNAKLTSNGNAHGKAGKNKDANSGEKSSGRDSTLEASVQSQMPAFTKRENPPLRGICYGALPCTEHACGYVGLPSEDMLQDGYAAQWGEVGRNDLGVMASLGANAVRLYHSLGLDADADHGGFLDRAKAVGLNVMAGYHTESANDPNECIGYDCFDAWKKFTLQGFEQGFKKNGGWHPAVSMLILLNEPDFFEQAPKCVPSGPWCRVKAALSAFDGVLAAEKEAGVAAGSVKFTVTWSFGIRASIDGVVVGPGTFGFQDMVAAIANPTVAHYTPRATTAELEQAFNARWIHGLNTQAPFGFVNDMVKKEYAKFSPIPWFIGEYGAMAQPRSVIENDLAAMEASAAEGNGFLGSAVFQFQTTYWKGGSEMNFGLFGLGHQELGRTGDVCDRLAQPCRSWPMHCLTTELKWLPGDKAERAQAVATAWGGSVPTGSGICSGSRRLRGFTI